MRARAFPALPASNSLPVRRVRSFTSACLLLAGAMLLCARPASAQSMMGEGMPRALAPDSLRTEPLSEAEALIHLMQRATWGVRPADLIRARTMGREAWLEEQLHPERLQDTALAPRLEPYPAAAMSIAQLYEAFPQSAQLQLARAASDTTLTDAERQRMRREAAAVSPARIQNDLVGARIVRAAHTERQLEDVLTDFWFNHFNVFFGKSADRYLVSAYEREAIRPHVLGRFEDMLLATARHPAMLFYLDNWRSSAETTPDPRDAVLIRRLQQIPEAQRRQWLRRQGLDPDRVRRISQALQQRGARGLNENYARELLELHTLGVEGGYTQQDVRETARVFTGWSMVLPDQRQNAAPRMMAGAAEGDAVGFRFENGRHDQETKSVLGRTIRPAGMQEGREVLHLLATHPSTARHIALKLAQRFAADAPPPALVDDLAKVFLESGGDLRAVMRALFTLPLFYDPALANAKVRSPLELVVASVRALDAEVQRVQGLSGTLREMGELPYACEVPTGYPEQAQEWVSAGAMLARMTLAMRLASGRVPGVRVEGLRANSRAATRDPEGMVDILLAKLLPGRDTGRLRAAVLAEIRMEVGDDPEIPAAMGERILGLILGSPDFQKH